MPERMCVVTRESGPEETRIRFALSPDGLVVPDLQRKLPGRGVWVSLARDKVAEAVKRQAFTRGFDEACRVDADMPERISALLRGQVISHLSLARKAGAAVCGAMKVEDAIAKGPVRVLLNAADGSVDGNRKVSRNAGAATLVCNLLQSSEMDLAFGRANVIHAAVTAGGLAERLVFLIQRMANYDGLALRGDDLKSK
jgi:uncharacterized protein